MQAGDTSRLLSRISYCTADKMHDKVFAYIAQSQHSESLECHAFLCTKRKVVSGGARPRGDRLRDLKKNRRKSPGIPSGCQSPEGTARVGVGQPGWTIWLRAVSSPCPLEVPGHIPLGIVIARV